jgi:hypothetical protein
MSDKRLTAVRLTRVMSNHSRLRTDHVDGFSPTYPPKIGTRFELFGEGLSDPSLTRMVETSEIQSTTRLPGGGGYHIATENSIYRVERIDASSLPPIRVPESEANIMTIVTPGEEADGE